MKCGVTGNKFLFYKLVFTKITYYFQALSISKEEKDKSVLFKNRAAVYLKTEEYDSVVRDCSDCEYHAF